MKNRVWIQLPISTLLIVSVLVQPACTRRSTPQKKATNFVTTDGDQDRNKTSTSDQETAIQAKIDEANELVEKSKTKITELESALEAAQTEVERLKKAGDVTDSSAQNALDEAKTKFAQAAARVSELEAQIGQLNQAAEAAKAQCSAGDTQSQETINKLETEIKTLTDARDKLKVDLDAALKKAPPEVTVAPATEIKYCNSAHDEKTQLNALMLVNGRMKTQLEAELKALIKNWETGEVYVVEDNNPGRGTENVQQSVEIKYFVHASAQDLLDLNKLVAEKAKENGIDFLQTHLAEVCSMNIKYSGALVRQKFPGEINSEQLTKWDIKKLANIDWNNEELKIDSDFIVSKKMDIKTVEAKPEELDWQNLEKKIVAPLSDKCLVVTKVCMDKIKEIDSAKTFIDQFDNYISDLVTAEATSSAMNSSFSNNPILRDVVVLAELIVSIPETEVTTLKNLGFANVDETGSIPVLQPYAFGTTPLSSSDVASLKLKDLTAVFEAIK